MITFLAYKGRINIGIKVGKYLLFLILWLGWAGFSLFWASDTVIAIRDGQYLFYGFVVITFSLIFFSDEKSIRNIPHLWAGLTLLAVGVAIWEIVTGTHLGASRQEALGWVGESYPTAFFYNRNDFATFLSLSLPFQFFLVRDPKRHLLRVLGMALILASFYIIMLLSSRGNIAASLLGICLMFLLVGWRARLKFIAVGMVAIGLIVLLGSTLAPGNYRSYLGEIQQVPQEIGSMVDGTDPSTQLRRQLTNEGLGFLESSHFLGIGAGNFEYHLERGPPHLYYLQQVSNAHNLGLEILVEYGVLIFALFLVFYIGLLSNLFHIFRHSENQTLRAVSVAAFISLVILAIASLSSSSLLGKGLVWLPFASGLCVINCYRLEQHREHIIAVSNEK